MSLELIVSIFFSFESTFVSITKSQTKHFSSYEISNERFSAINSFKLIDFEFNYKTYLFKLSALSIKIILLISRLFIWLISNHNSLSLNSLGKKINFSHVIKRFINFKIKSLIFKSATKILVVSYKPFIEFQSQKIFHHQYFHFCT